MTAASERAIIDVTRALYDGHPTWPGDDPFSLTQVAHIARGDSVNVMRLETSNHVGTHLDAPYHYDDGGARLQGVPLTWLVGECLVIDAQGDGAVGAEVATSLGPLGGGSVPPRVLIRTGEPDRWETFPADFRPLSVALVDALADLGVVLVGTDAPSVDVLDSKDLAVHAAFARRGLVIVEGLALDAVTPGRYELVCLPLRLHDADASPVRAVLRPLD
ncbi:arylformamidase [soil metagenome]